MAGKELFTRLTFCSPRELIICNISHFPIWLRVRDIGSDCTFSWPLPISFLTQSLLAFNLSVYTLTLMFTKAFSPNQFRPTLNVVLMAILS